MGYLKGWQLPADVPSIHGGGGGQRKVYRPIGEDVVEKMFIGHGAATPPGWYDLTEEAKAAWPERKAEIEAEKRGAAKAK